MPTRDDGVVAGSAGNRAFLNYAMPSNISRGRAQVAKLNIL
jgi:hypothetical protein